MRESVHGCSLPKVLAITCLILTTSLILLRSSSDSSHTLDRDGGMISHNIPLTNDSLPAVGWSEDIRLTNDAAFSYFPDIASEGRNVHVVWEHYGNETGMWKYYLMYKRSTDGGFAWDDGLGNIGKARVLFDLGSYIPVVGARVGVNGSNVHIAYYGRHGDFWWPTYMNSTTNGESWSEPRMIGNKTDGGLGVLDIAVWRSNVHIAWTYRPDTSPAQVYYSMSPDGGVSWSNATRMISLSWGHCIPDIEAEGENVHLAYTDGGLHKIYYGRSLDNGKSWDDGLGNVGSQRLLFLDPVNSLSDPYIAVRDGWLHLVWEKRIPNYEWDESEGRWMYAPYHQMLYMNSEDNGGYWSAAKVLVDHTDIPWLGRKPYGHYVDVHDIEASETDVHVVFSDTRDDKTTTEIYYKMSNDKGNNWTGDIRLTNAPNNSARPMAAVDVKIILVVWIDNRDDNNPYTHKEAEIYYKRYPALGPPPPTNLEARLEGTSFANVNISWEGPKTGENESSVHRYDIFYGDRFDWNGNGYALLGFGQASSESSYYYVHEGAGEGNPNNYFYYVCSVNVTNHSSCTYDQAGKFTRPLSNGPNLLSIPLIQSNGSIEKVLQTVEFDKAWTYDSSSEKWMWYVTFKPYRGDLRSMNETKGFWVGVTKDCNFTVAGIVPFETAIHLEKGWNLVSFPSFASYSVGELRADVNANRIEGFDLLAEPYHLRLLSELDKFQAGHGYWVWVENGSLWTVTN